MNRDGRLPPDSLDAIEADKNASEKSKLSLDQ